VLILTKPKSTAPSDELTSYISIIKCGTCARRFTICMKDDEKDVFF